MHPPPAPVSSCLDVLISFLAAIANAIAMIDVEGILRCISQALTRSWHFILRLPVIICHALKTALPWIEDSLSLIGRILLLLCLWLAIVFAIWTLLFLATRLICLLTQSINQWHRRTRAERQPLLLSHHHPIRYSRPQRAAITDRNGRSLHAPIVTDRRQMPRYSYTDYRNHESRRHNGFAPQARPLATMTEAQLLHHQTVMNWLVEPPTVRRDDRIGFPNARQPRLASYGTMPLLPPPPYQSVVPPPPSYSSQAPPPPYR
ncbi:hypothetical protein BDV97DRAFT_341866 [Delphinella strobiligena]|nr:hypothetical protein BDV97DRAFT_341866 [Delphinella strobiligena]